MNDREIEQEIQAKGLTAPRVTLAGIEANIAVEAYFTANNGAVGAAVEKEGKEIVHAQTKDEQARLWQQADVSLSLLTFCVLVLRNGFTVTGESACASPENFDAEIGRKIARQNAIAKVWPLMGYELKERIHATALYGERVK